MDFEENIESSFYVVWDGLAKKEHDARLAGRGSILFLVPSLSASVDFLLRFEEKRNGRAYELTILARPNDVGRAFDKKYKTAIECLRYGHLIAKGAGHPRECLAFMLQRDFSRKYGSALIDCMGSQTSLSDRLAFIREYYIDPAQARLTSYSDCYNVIRDADLNQKWVSGNYFHNAIKMAVLAKTANISSDDLRRDLVDREDGLCSELRDGLDYDYFFEKVIL